MQSPLKEKLVRSDRFHDALTIARQAGLLRGAETEVVRGRMPKALVRKARATSGARSNTELSRWRWQIWPWRISIQTGCSRSRGR
jgi:hypothetical protein